MKIVKINSIKGEVFIVESKIIGMFPPRLIWDYPYILMEDKEKILIPDYEYHNLKNHYFKKFNHEHSKNNK